MYKKITHNIIEEHFDHPIGSQIKKSMEKSKLVTNEIFSESQFRADLHNHFQSYISNLSLLINAAAGTDEDLIVAFDNFFKTNWVDDLGNMTKPLYVTEFGERCNQAFRSMATTVLLAIQTIKTGKDSSQLFNRMQYSTNELATTLSNFNNVWQYNAVNTLLTAFATDIFALIKAKISKNTTTASQLEQKIYGDWATFERIFIDGIITHHPERFNKATTKAESSYSREIM